VHQACMKVRHIGHFLGGNPSVTAHTRYNMRRDLRKE
jgi:hypothetical protein